MIDDRDAPGTAAAFIGYCERCGTAVAEDQAAYPVTGWEARRTAGGANAILDRRRVPGKVAHESCVRDHARRRRAGHVPVGGGWEQGTFDDDAWSA
jgi:hypothetical protein